MKYSFIILLQVLFLTIASGQVTTTLVEGEVSFLSSRNVYVKFASTEGIKIGDTLFIQNQDSLFPALTVNNKSSTSTVCVALTSEKINISDRFFAKVILKEKVKEPAEQKKTERITLKEEEEPAEHENLSPVIVPDEEKPLFREKIRSRISAASYTSLSDFQNTHRMRYSFTFQGDHLNNSRFSTDNYITFRHTLGEWEEVQENFANALKIYALSVKYDFDSTTNVTLGRKINPKFSSIGAIDGLQFEKYLGHFHVGAIAGSRPDFNNYSLNFNLLQAGAFVGYDFGKNLNARQSTFGFIEQRNAGNTDRRFVYFQHRGEVVKHLHLFSSFEIDLFELRQNEKKNTLRLTNLFVSLRYRLYKNLRFSASYDNRKNIIYYESYKNFIDQLIDDETRQGLRLGVNYRPVKYITWGINSGLRFQKSNANTSRNLNTYVNISRIPGIKARASLSANFLQTGYLNSQIYGARLSKDIIKRILGAEIYYRMVNYQYRNLETDPVQQDVVGATLSLQLWKGLGFYLYYEGTFSNNNQNYTRINTRIIQRF